MNRTVKFDFPSEQPVFPFQWKALIVPYPHLTLVFGLSSVLFVFIVLFCFVLFCFVLFLVNLLLYLVMN